MSEPSKAMMRDMAEADRPREKALRLGCTALTDAELLAILLRVGVQGKNVIQLSQEILASCENSLVRLARMTPRELSRKVPGIGTTKAVTLQAALELGLRFRGAVQQEEHTQMAGSSAIDAYMRHKLERLDHEEFWVMMLNNRLCVESIERISQGGMAATVVDVKQVMKRVIDAQAAAIALIHNHPSGTLRPSAQDDELTRKICGAAALMDIRVIDHIIITPSAYYSYNDEGRMPS